MNWIVYIYCICTIKEYVFYIWIYSLSRDGLKKDAVPPFQVLMLDHNSIATMTCVASLHQNCNYTIYHGSLMMLQNSKCMVYSHLFTARQVHRLLYTVSSCLTVAPLF